MAANTKRGPFTNEPRVFVCVCMGGGEKTGRHSLDRHGALLERRWEAGELSTTDYLVQLRQSLDTRESALDLQLTLWLAWFEWLAASGQVDNWLGLGGKT